MNDVNEIWVDEKVNELCDRVRQIAYELHVYLGTGYLENIYERGMLNRLSKVGIHCESQAPVDVFDEDGFLLGEYKLYLVVENVLVIELKATRAIDDTHIAQILGF